MAVHIFMIKWSHIHYDNKIRLSKCHVISHIFVLTLDMIGWPASTHYCFSIKCTWGEATFSLFLCFVIFLGENWKSHFSVVCSCTKDKLGQDIYIFLSEKKITAWIYVFSSVCHCCSAVMVQFPQQELVPAPAMTLDFHIEMEFESRKERSYFSVIAVRYAWMVPERCFTFVSLTSWFPILLYIHSGSTSCWFP